MHSCMVPRFRTGRVAACRSGNFADRSGRLLKPPQTPPSRRTRRWLIRYPRALPVAIFLLIAAITAMSVFAIERSERASEKSRLKETAASIASALDRRGNTTSSYLRAGAALFSTVDAVPPSLFRRFVAELRLDADYRGAEGIGWAEHLRAAEVLPFEQRIEAIRPAMRSVRPYPPTDPDNIVPVTYLLPDTERNRRALGYDMWSDPVRRAAMAEAFRLARPTASGKVVLKQEGEGDAPGFLVYMPVFERGTRAIKGFIYSPFAAQEFLDHTVRDEVIAGRGVQLYEGRAEATRLLASVPPEQASGRYATSEFRLANRTMVVQVESAQGNALSFISMLTLLFGLAVASLSMLVARLLTQQAYEDQASLDYFAEQNSIRNSLTRELNHRVKNTLANVLSIVSLTRRRATELDEFADGLDGRIRALSATHDLLTKSEWGTTPIRDVLETEMAPYAQSDDSQVSFDGPHVELAPNDALSFGLAIHELATNASKYGALSQPGGRVEVTWDRLDNDLARVSWRESGGPSVPQDRNRGFGTELIEKIVAHELRHPVQLDFDRAGVRCRMDVPVREPSAFAIRAHRRAEPVPSMASLKDVPPEGSGS